MIAEEAALDPHRAIVDPHHHFWEIMPAPGLPQAPQRFLLHDMLATVAASGHNITHTVAVECHAMHRADGPDAMKPVGEVEFLNGIAAMSASGAYGPARYAAAIVGTANLMLGEAVAPVLEAEAAAAGGRLRGIRYATAWSAAGMFGYPADPAGRYLMRDPGFVAGAGVLARMGLSLDIWCFHTQLAEVEALAAAHPGLSIILDHIGTPETLGAYAGRADAARAEWRAALTALARHPNVTIKIGGMGMDVSRMIDDATGPATSADLADRWRPHVEDCLAIFGADRAMFESNFPPDRAAGSYGAIWNAFKRIAAPLPESDKAALFSGTASRIYRLHG